MKKIVLALLTAAILLTATGCGENAVGGGEITSSEVVASTQDDNTIAEESTVEENPISEQAETTETTTYYQKVTVTDCNGTCRLIPQLDNMRIGNGLGESFNTADGYHLYCEYQNRLILSFDTQTGKCTGMNMEIYCYGEDSADECAAILQSDDALAKCFSDESYEPVKDDIFVVKAVVDVDAVKYYLDQYVSTYFLESTQNIERFKNTTYYDRVSNYDEYSVLTVEDEENHFFGSIEGFALDWE